MSILLKRIRASPLLTKRLTPISSSPISPTPSARPIHIDHRFPPSFFNEAAQHGYIAKQFSTVAPKPKDPNPPSPHSSSTASSSPFDFVPRSAREKRLNRVWWFFVALNFGIAGYIFLQPKKKDKGTAEGPFTPAASTVASAPEKPLTEPDSAWSQPRG